MSVLNALEYDVICDILEKSSLHWRVLANDYPEIVLDRTMTGVGINTSFKRDERLHVSSKRGGQAIGDTLVMLNGTTEVEFFLKLEDGFISWMEGYVFGDDQWPDSITGYKIDYQ